MQQPFDIIISKDHLIWKVRTQKGTFIFHLDVMVPRPVGTTKLHTAVILFQNGFEIHQRSIELFTALMHDGFKEQHLKTIGPMH